MIDIFLSETGHWTTFHYILFILAILRPASKIINGTFLNFC